MVRIILLLVLILTVFIWQVVGLWRAARKLINGGHRPLFPYLAAFSMLPACAIVGFEFVSSTVSLRELVPLVLESQQDRRARYSLELRGNVLIVSGFIEFGISGDVQSVLDRNPNIKVIWLEGPGGRLIEGRKLRDVILAKQLSTFSRKNCASACTLAFIAGQHRTLYPGGKLGFHRLRNISLEDDAKRVQTTIDRNYLARRGVQDWFSRQNLPDARKPNLVSE